MPRAEPRVLGGNGRGRTETEYPPIAEALERAHRKRITPRRQRGGLAAVSPANKAKSRQTRKEGRARGTDVHGARTFHPDPAMRAALDVPRLTLSGIARALGVTRETVESWRKGRRRSRLESKMRLAELLSAHAQEVSAVAAELRADPRRKEGERGGR
jgi:hypothetical protein